MTSVPVDFLTDFYVFLADIMPKYDQVLIVGDCNIYVCCPEKPLARDFFFLFFKKNI